VLFIFLGSISAAELELAVYECGNVKHRHFCQRLWSHFQDHDAIKRGRLEAAVLKTLLTISLLLLLEFSAPAQQGQTPPKTAPVAPDVIPADAARRANPVKPTPESIEKGKKWWGYDCAMCHGKDGDGKGDIAADMKLKVTDFTDPATLKDRTDGELYHVIKNGKGDMPPEGKRMKPDGIWDLVNYVRSLAKQSAPPEDKTPR
jgi:mono/diheme cytochrome c family protein